MLLSLSLASATPPAELLPPAVQQGAQLVAACGPVGGAAGALHGSPLMAMLSARTPPALAPMVALLEPAELARAGIDGAGTLSLQLGRELLVSVPFSGTGEQALSLLQRLPTATVEGDDRRWLVTSDGGVELQAGLFDGQLLIQGDDPPEVPMAALDPAFAEGLPVGPGCALLFASARGASGPRTTAIFLPLGEGDALIRLALPEPLGLEAEAGEVLYGTSPDQPMLLLSAQLSPAALLERPKLQESLAEQGLEPARLDELPITFLPGMSVAVFGDPGRLRQRLEPEGGVEVAAVLPAQMDSGRPLRPRLVARKARRGLAEQGVVVSRAGGRGLVVALDDEGAPIHVRVQKDRILLASTEGRVEGMDAGEGARWSSADHAARAADWPVVATAALSGLPIPGGALQISVGARSQGTMLELGLQAGDGAAVIAGLTALGNELKVLFEEVSQELEGAAPAE